MLKSNRGGKRTPGPGKTLGRPKTVENGEDHTIYTGDETEKILKRISPVRSEAIRIAAEFWEKNQTPTA